MPVAGPIRRSFLAVVGAALTLAPPAVAATPPVPIPEGPGGEQRARLHRHGRRAQAGVAGAHVPRHPFMAANGRSNLHNDAYQTDTYTWAGPRGSNMERLSTFMGGECAIGDLRPRGPDRDGLRRGRRAAPRRCSTRTRSTCSTVFPLPPRIPSPASGGNPFTDFSGGGYFYLDNHDRAVIPTTTRHIWVIGQTANRRGPAFQLERDYDVSAAVPAGDGIISALPDWAGRIWFVSGSGVVGIVDPGDRRGEVGRHSASGSATRSRSTRPVASTSSPTWRCTGSTRHGRLAARRAGARPTPTSASGSRARHRPARARRPP